MNKASGGEGIPVELFQILKDDAVKVLHPISQQIWKTAAATGLEKVSFITGLPFSSPGHLPDPGIESGSPILQADALPSEPPGKPSQRKATPKNAQTTTQLHSSHTLVK